MPFKTLSHEYLRILNYKRHSRKHRKYASTSVTECNPLPKTVLSQIFANPREYPKYTFQVPRYTCSRAACSLKAEQITPANRNASLRAANREASCESRSPGGATRLFRQPGVFTRGPVDEGRYLERGPRNRIAAPE